MSTPDAEDSLLKTGRKPSESRECLPVIAIPAACTAPFSAGHSTFPTRTTADRCWADAANRGKSPAAECRLRDDPALSLGQRKVRNPPECTNSNLTNGVPATHGGWIMTLQDLKGPADVRAFFHTNTVPLYFISPPRSTFSDRPLGTKLLPPELFRLFRRQPPAGVRPTEPGPQGLRFHG